MNVKKISRMLAVLCKVGKFLQKASKMIIQNYAVLSRFSYRGPV